MAVCLPGLIGIFYVCTYCPDVIISSVPFHSQKCVSLDHIYLVALVKDKSLGHQLPTQTKPTKKD